MSLIEAYLDSEGYEVVEAPKDTSDLGEAQGDSAIADKQKRTGSRF
jgi:hypothetical protein